ncbi:hypothetical protein CHS0354_000161 [Potamilus streckersoni]|uniref:Uncharacterized protein n=1 Tax=Potamilus streckersoni TaxID=2493646 RepID=A0AAE0TJC0_9BIVA|nr:hypothetical protein CHS0354_000161 [Potamilus streckersoni]
MNDISGTEDKTSIVHIRVVEEQWMDEFSRKKSVITFLPTLPRARYENLFDPLIIHLNNLDVCLSPSTYFETISIPHSTQLRFTQLPKFWPYLAEVLTSNPPSRSLVILLRPQQ